MGVGPSWPGVGYNLLVFPFAKTLGKAQYWGGNYPIFQVLCVSFPLARKRDSLPPCASQVRRCLALLQLLLVGLHQLTSTDCLALPSEMNPVPQLKMQKSLVFCVFVLGVGDWSCSYSAILPAIPRKLFILPILCKR